MRAPARRAPWLATAGAASRSSPCGLVDLVTFRDIEPYTGRSRRSAAELQDEARLIEAAKRDRKAFATVYNRYFDQIYSFCYYHTGRREEAEDLASETFQRALEGLPDFEWRGIPYSAWLYRVASNLMAKQRRRPAWIELPEPTSGSPEDDPERRWLRREQGDELHAAVRRLPLDQRHAVLLKFEARLKNREIGRIMGRSEGAVKLLLFRAVHGLRRRMGSREKAR